MCSILNKTILGQKYFKIFCFLIEQHYKNLGHSNKNWQLIIKVLHG